MGGQGRGGRTHTHFHVVRASVVLLVQQLEVVPPGGHEPRDVRGQGDMPCPAPRTPEEVGGSGPAPQVLTCTHAPCHSPSGLGHLGAELGELSRCCPLGASLGGDTRWGLTLPMGAPAHPTPVLRSWRRLEETGDRSHRKPSEERGRGGWRAGPGSGYLAHKGHQLGTCRALIWAQPELRVVIRSHRELDVS